MDDPTLDELEYYQRLQPPREEPFEAGATMVASLAVVAGLASLWWIPMKLGLAAMILALVAVAFAGPGSGRYARLALTLTTVCWFVGSLLGVLLKRDVW